MGIKSVYVCDNCGAEQIFKTEPIQIGRHIEHPFIHTHNPDYTGTTSLCGEQYFCNEKCLHEFLTKKGEKK